MKIIPTAQHTNMEKFCLHTQQVLPRRHLPGELEHFQLLTGGDYIGYKNVPSFSTTQYLKAIQIIRFLSPSFVIMFYGVREAISASACAPTPDEQRHLPTCEGCD